MGIRRRSRELAIQALFYMDISKNDSKEAVELFCDNFAPSKNTLPFFLELVNGVIDYRSEIDCIIERFSSNWKIGRMACVDRNIIRIAVYELLFCNDIPSKVSINEAIDVGKKFGTEESGAFINGILDSIRIALEKEEINIVTAQAHSSTVHGSGLESPARRRQAGMKVELIEQAKKRNS